MSILTNLLTFETTTAATWRNLTVFTCMALLVILLVEKEVLRAIDSERFATWIAIVDVAVVPLLFVFATVVLTQLLNLL